jgi:hypothetical protein
VTNLYLRDLLLIDMSADKKTRRGADSTRTDQIGKVFIAVGQDLRQCLICDGMFTRKGAAEHANTVCLSRNIRSEHSVVRNDAAQREESHS